MIIDNFSQGIWAVQERSDSPTSGQPHADFKDVTYGNGVFVAVGADEIIYTSADGDTWTKVHGK